MRTSIQGEQILGSLEVARRQSMAAGLPRMAIAYAGVWSIKAMIITIRRIVAGLKMAVTRKGPATVTNSRSGARFQGGKL